MPTLTAIAKHLGVTQPRASQLKSEGMPTNSLRAAKLWRDRQQQKREATNGRRKTANVQAGKAGRPRKKSTPAKTGDSLADSLTDAVTISQDAFLAYQDALPNEKSARLSEFNKALNGRQVAERLYREELERRAILVPKAEVMEKCRRCLDTVLRRLKKLPSECGPQCSPTDPLKSVSILQRAVDEIMRSGQTALQDLR